jgi:hypothetical protein
MVGFTVIASSMLVALSLAAPVAQVPPVTAPLTTPNGAPAGIVSLGPAPPRGDARPVPYVLPPPFGGPRPPYGGPLPPFGGPLSPPPFDGPVPDGPEPYEPIDEEVEPPYTEAPQFEPGVESCLPGVWYQPWSWGSVCTTETTGDVDSSFTTE